MFTKLFTSNKLAAALVAFSALITFSNTVHADEISELPSGKYSLDLTHASIVWKVSHFGLSNYAARFNDFDATLDLDTANFEKSSVSVEIKTASLDTDYPYAEKKDFNKKLIDGEGWFNGSAFPTISFVSKSLSPLTGNKAQLTGDLTFLGMTKLVTLDVTLNGAMVKHPFSGVAALGFSATTTIKRSDWGFVKYLPNIGDEVLIQIEAEFQNKG